MVIALATMMILVETNMHELFPMGKMTLHDFIYP